MTAVKLHDVQLKEHKSSVLTRRSRVKSRTFEREVKNKCGNGHCHRSLRMFAYCTARYCCHTNWSIK